MSRFNELVTVAVSAFVCVCTRVCVHVCREAQMAQRAHARNTHKLAQRQIMSPWKCVYV